MSSAPAPDVDYDEVFEGFGEDSSAEAPEAQPAKSATPKKEKTAKKEKARKTPASPEVVKKQPDNLVSNVFKALDEDAAEQEIDVSAWAELDLSSNTLSALSKLGFSKPTPIQAAAIPEILAGHDVVG